VQTVLVTDLIADALILDTVVREMYLMNIMTAVVLKLVLELADTIKHIETEYVGT